MGGLSLRIIRIKDLDFFIDEGFDIDITSLENIDIQWNSNIVFKKEEKRFDFTIGIKFQKKGDQKESFLGGHFLTSFFTENVDDFLNKSKDKYDIPDQAIITMFSLSVTHARALLAKASMGSRYNDLYLPAINPTELLRQVHRGLLDLDKDKKKQAKSKK